MEDHLDSIVNKVYEFRVLAKLSQSELAQAVGVSKQTIFVMEKNTISRSYILPSPLQQWLEPYPRAIITFVTSKGKKLLPGK